jgi:hypothetical protein
LREITPLILNSRRAFLATDARESIAVDFFLVPTLTFRLLFVFAVLRHDRRALIHLIVTDHPAAVWTARQLIEAFPEETAEVPPPGSRRDLRRGLHPVRRLDGDPAGDDRLQRALAVLARGKIPVGRPAHACPLASLTTRPWWHVFASREVGRSNL